MSNHELILRVIVGGIVLSKWMTESVSEPVSAWVIPSVSESVSQLVSQWVTKSGS